MRTPLLAWRTLRTYRLTLEPPRYIKRAPTMCHFEVKNVRTLVRGPNSGAFHQTTCFQPQKAGFLGRILQKVARIKRARVCTPLLAWRTLRAFRLTLGPPRYIRRAPTMCHFEVTNVPTLVPSIIPPVANLKKLDVKAEFWQNWLELDAHVCAHTPFGVAHLTRIPFDLRTTTIHQKGPCNVSF